MNKIRVAFLLNVDENWLGGVNYYKNLLTAIVENEYLKIEPILFIPQNADLNLFAEYPQVLIKQTNLLSKWSIFWFIRKILCRILNRDILFEKLLKLNKVDIISHIQDDLKHINIPTVAWIPDFQHKYLTDLFSKKELECRDKSFYYLAQNCDSVILSSNDAKKDFLKFFFQWKKKSEVLQFVVIPRDFCKTPNFDSLKEKYKINSKFFYLPNQYWVHKNHKVVLEALNILKEEGKKIVVVSSGNTMDYRNKDHFFTLQEYIHGNNLSDYYHVLGKIPYGEVQLLSKKCLAFINPSLFEGWSTTVEEAKSMGKKIVLSNIQVHVEQNPEGGKFFNPKNPKALAELLWSVWNEKESEEFLQINIKEKNEKRKRIFAEKYRNILDNTMRRFKLR